MPATRLQSSPSRDVVVEGNAIERSDGDRAGDDEAERQGDDTASGPRDQYMRGQERVTARG